MKPLKNQKRRSIGRKLTLSYVFLSGMSVLLACVGLLTYDIHMARQDLSRQQSSVAEVIGHNSAATLMFEDADGAAQILSGLKAQEEVRVACLFTFSGELLAKYPVDTSSECDSPETGMAHASYDSDELRLYQTVEMDGDVVGSLVVHRGLDDLREHIVNRFYISGAIFLFAMLVSLLMASPLQRFLTGPILHLAEVARRVTSEDEYSLRADQRSNDELGDLTLALNEMLQRIEERDRQLEEYSTDLEAKIQVRTIELHESNESLIATNQRLEEEFEEREELNRKLVETSREAGMAEVATGVLHNVGNVLNSVNVGIELLREKARTSKSSGLSRVMDLANEHSDDPARYVAEHPKGQIIFPYLTRLGQTLLEEQAQTIEDLDNVQKSVNHINDIVATQQDYARPTAIGEVVPLAPIIDEAIRINHTALDDSQVEIVRDPQEQAATVADRHRVLQIMVNLIRNAQQAFDEIDRDDKRLTIRVLAVEDKLVIALEDNGPGIEADNLNRIFNHGFTTKKRGHGFGLHSCATSAMEMRGSLSVRSNGLGCGAVFTLELPILASDGKSEAAEEEGSA